DRPLLDSKIRKSGNKDDRRSTMCGRQSALQLETVDARHLNIRNDAGRFAKFRRLQQLFSGRKTPSSESERPNEVCRRDANGFIVIDNRNERFFCHCSVILEHWWCLHKTGDSTMPELPQSKAVAYQDLLSAPRTRPTPSHRGPAVVDQSVFSRLGHAVAEIHSSQTALRPNFRPLHNQSHRRLASRMSVGTNLPSAKPPCRS